MLNSDSLNQGTDQAPLVLSVVIPMYNEADVVAALFERLLPVLRKLDASFEVICVNDGSEDESLAKLLALREREPTIKILDLARNFGKEAALTAGLELARGLAAIPMDADLQHPPELIAEMVAAWRAGNDVVYGVRGSRGGEGLVKRSSSSAFYRVFNGMASHSIPANVGDFRLLDQRVVATMRNFPERTRFMKGLFSIVGFKQTAVYFEAEPRAAGLTKWRYWKLWNFALDGLTSFTSAPLRMWSYVGIAILIPSFTYAAWLVVRTLVYGIDVPGYASLAIMMLFFGGLQLVSIGILGEYVARIFTESKRRPVYIVKDVYGMEAEELRAFATSGTLAAEPGWKQIAKQQ